MPLVAVGSHDTASAVVAVPASGPRFAYISSGTWSLVGLELDAPVLTEESRLANFTNEAGIDGTIRYLRNVTGLWLLQECLRTWGLRLNRAPAGRPGRAPDRLTARCWPRRPGKPLRFVVDADDPVFLPPGDMPARIAPGCPRAVCPRRPLPPSSSGASWTAWRWPTGAPCWPRSRCPGSTPTWCTSSAAGPATTLLCQLTADATGLPVVAGPAEATALGNVLVQARALGAAPADAAGACGPCCDPAWRCGPFTRHPGR